MKIRDNEEWGQVLMGRVQDMGLTETPLEHACGTFALAGWAERVNVHPIVTLYLLNLAEEWLEVHYEKANRNVYYIRVCSGLQKRRAEKPGKRKTRRVSR